MKERKKRVCMCVCACMYMCVRERGTVRCISVHRMLALLTHSFGSCGHADNQATHTQLSEMSIEPLNVAISQLLFSYAMFQCACHMSDFPYGTCVSVLLCVCASESRAWKAVITLKSIECEFMSADFLPRAVLPALQTVQLHHCLSPAWLHTQLVSGRLFITRRCVTVCGGGINCVSACSSVLVCEHRNVLFLVCPTVLGFPDWM